MTSAFLVDRPPQWVSQDREIVTLRYQVQVQFGWRWMTEAEFSTLDEAEDMAAALWDGGSGWDRNRLRIKDAETQQIVGGHGSWEF